MTWIVSSPWNVEYCDLHVVNVQNKQPFVLENQSVLIHQASLRFDVFILICDFFKLLFVKSYKGQQK